MNLNQVTIPVTDINASINFYKKLGLHLIVHTHDRYARFACPDGQNSTLSLHVVDDISANHRSIIYFEHEGMDDYIDKLISIGIIIDLMPTDQSWLWREARLRDPDNNPIIIYYAGENRLDPPWRRTEDV